MNNNISDFGKSYAVSSRRSVLGWNHRFAMSVEEKSDGTKYCVCWIGTVEVLESDSGGWAEPQGIALGFEAEGNPQFLFPPEWEEQLVSFDEIAGRDVSLTLAAWVAPQLATIGDLLIADKRFAKIVESELDIVETSKMLEANPNYDNFTGILIQTALYLLWTCNQRP